MRPGLLLLAAAIGISTACTPVVSDREWVVDGDFSAVDVRLANGDLQIEPANGRLVEIAADFGGVAHPGGVSRFVEDDTLVIDFACALCGGDLRVGIPDGMPVTASLGHGDLGIEDVRGDVIAEVGAGSITGEDLGGRVEAFANAGGIELEFDFRPAEVVAEAHAGAVLLEVPAGAYNVDARSNAGVVRLVDIVHDADDPTLLWAFTHAGGIEILGQ